MSIESTMTCEIYKADGSVSTGPRFDYNLAHKPLWFASIYLVGLIINLIFNNTNNCSIFFHFKYIIRSFNIIKYELDEK